MAVTLNLPKTPESQLHLLNVHLSKRLSLQKSWMKVRVRWDNCFLWVEHGTMKRRDLMVDIPSDFHGSFVRACSSMKPIGTCFSSGREWVKKDWDFYVRRLNRQDSLALKLRLKLPWGDNTLTTATSTTTSPPLDVQQLQSRRFMALVEGEWTCNGWRNLAPISCFQCTLTTLNVIPQIWESSWPIPPYH